MKMGQAPIVLIGASPIFMAGTVAGTAPTNLRSVPGASHNGA